MTRVQIRLGVDSCRAAILDLRVPLLVSANSLWNDDAQRFSGFARYAGHDIALDSSGFVAMRLYGGYRWTPEQYAALAAAMRPAWWAQMDFCCEPEIAASRAEVESRIGKTIDGLRACRGAGRNAQIPAPMPVLQGYEPTDYIAGPIFDEPLPDLIGVGSVCRRHLRGRKGLMAVIDAIDRKVPRATRLHLFGVKGTALRAITNEFSQREFSADSMAYMYAARWDVWKHGGRKDYDCIASHAKTWLAQNQIAAEPQLKLL